MSSEVDMTLSTDYGIGNPAGMVAVPGVIRPINQLMNADCGQSAGQCAHASAQRMSSRANESLSANYPSGVGRIPPVLLNRRASSAGANVLLQRRGSSGSSSLLALNRRGSSVSSDGQFPGTFSRRMSSEVDLNLSTDHQGNSSNLHPASLNKGGSSLGSSRMLRKHSSSGGVLPASLCKRASSLGSSGMLQSITKLRAGTDIDRELSTDYRGVKQASEEMSGGATVTSFVRRAMRSRSASVGVEADADDELETDDELNPDADVAKRASSASTAASIPSCGVSVLRAAAAFGGLSARASKNLSVNSSLPASPAHPSRSPAALPVAGPGAHAGDTSDDCESDAQAGCARSRHQAGGIGAFARIAASEKVQQQQQAEYSAGCSPAAGPTYVGSRPPPISLSLRDSGAAAIPLASPRTPFDQCPPRCSSDEGRCSVESPLYPRSRRGSKDAGRIAVPMEPLPEDRVSVPSSPVASRPTSPASQRWPGTPPAHPCTSSDACPPQCSPAGRSFSSERPLNPRSRRGSKDAACISMAMEPLFEDRANVPSSPEVSRPTCPASPRRQESVSPAAQRRNKSPSPASRRPLGKSERAGSAKNVLEELSEVSQRI
mmetsp:Transcript_18172/g.39192  ORF Transcript_18172/g.39192 Transcript_18172/m.39192 type:complete len:605 (-) Transcript_18172:345-2159(-)